MRDSCCMMFSKELLQDPFCRIDHVHRAASRTEQIPVIAIYLTRFNGFLFCLFFDQRFLAFSTYATLLNDSRLRIRWGLGTFQRRIRTCRSQACGIIFITGVGWQAILLCGSDSQFIAAFVFLNSGVPFHPFEFNGVPLEHLKKSFPEVNIFCSFTGCSKPVVAAPLHHRTARDGIHDIFRIAEKRYSARALETLQGNDDCHQFHAVVGGLPKSARQFLAMFSGHQHDAVASRSWIGFSSSIGIDGHPLSFRIVAMI